MVYKDSCCVAGCENKTSTRHRWPKPYEIERFSAWKVLVCNKRLTNLSNEHVYKVYKICRSHFSEDCFSPGTIRLNANAVPSLHLPASSSNPPVASVIDDHNYCTTQSSATGSSHTSIPALSADNPVPVTEGTVNCSNHAEKHGLNDINTVKSLSTVTVEEGPSNLSGSSLPVPGVHAQSSGTDTAKYNRRRSLLQSLGVSGLAQLTPKARHLYSRAKQMSRVANYHRKRNVKLNESLKAAEDFLNTDTFKDITLPPLVKDFFVSQINTSKYKPRGRRFKMHDKVLALSIYKKGGKCYRYLSKIFNLPSPKSLRKLLGKVPFSAGINRKIFFHLQKHVSSLSTINRLCILSFDEMSLASHVEWHEKNDVVNGFEDFGHERTNNLANHVLVFMVSGLVKKWKQPVCFTFCQATTKSEQLVRLLKSVIRNLQSTGLMVLATVCDQNRTNVAAIKTLINDTRAYFLKKGEECKFDGFCIDGCEIIPLYDVPHLMKGIRNNLLKYNLHFVEDGVTKVGKWEHVEQLYEIDRHLPSRIRYCPKITELHVTPSKVKKMKVSCCVQIFSRTVSTAMRFIAERPSPGRPSLPPEATQTADLLLFLDELFDSLNSSSASPVCGKSLKCMVSAKSQHVEFWKNSLQVLKSMKFHGFNGTPLKIPSIENLIWTVEKISVLWNHIHLGFGVKYLGTRALNQDHLENFFSSVRAHGVRFVNPTCSSFISSFKSLIISNFLSSHSVGSNCEESQHDALCNLRDLLLDTTHEEEQDVDVVPLSSVDLPQPVDLDFYNLSVVEYVAGYVVKRVKQQFPCEECHNAVSTNCILSQHAFIKNREYFSTEKHMAYSSVRFSRAFHIAVMCIFSLLPNIAHQRGVKNIIVQCIRQKLPLPLTSCSEHSDKLTNFFIDIVCRVIIHRWCRIINNIAAGREKPADKRDAIQNKAFENFIKTSKRKV